MAAGSMATARAAVRMERARKELRVRRCVIGTAPLVVDVNANIGPGDGPAAVQQVRYGAGAGGPAAPVWQVCGGAQPPGCTARSARPPLSAAASAPACSSSG